MRSAQEAIKAMDPDILCLQEVRDWGAVQELVSVVPGMSVVVVSTFSGAQQQAIAAKLPPDSAWASKWQGSGKTGPPRGYAFAALRRSDGRMVLVYSLHLKANGRGTDDAAKREDSVRQLLSHIAAMGAPYKSAPVILAGDFNTTLDGEERFASERTLPDLAAAGFHWTAAGIPFEKRITHPGSGEWPAVSFDHIFVRGLRILKLSVPEVPGVSDHLPVVVELE